MRKRILLVEDEEDNMQILRDLLAPGYELVEADNGEKALAEAAKQRPDLILMDLGLPRLDGWAADHGRLRGDAPPQGPTRGCARCRSSRSRPMRWAKMKPGRVRRAATTL